jgi:predicted flap endonuclease-1-like 5' DNA nuclease
MRIIIEIEGDEAGAPVTPASVTITFPQVDGSRAEIVQQARDTSADGPSVAEDAGPAPLLSAWASAPTGYAVAPPLPADDSRDVVRAMRLPTLDAGPPVAGAATEPMASPDQPGAQAKPDDLTVIDGIGPKIASTLEAAGITTYDQLANTKVSELQEILSNAGIRANAETWPGQAAVAATHDTAALEAYQADLKID